MRYIYRFKKSRKNDVKKLIKFKELADMVGVTPSYISCIVNGKKDNISKTLAYCMCKAISKDLEIKDLFDVYMEE